MFNKSIIAFTSLKIFIIFLLCIGSTVVELLTRNPMVEGLNLVTLALEQRQ
jgi:hypothetical protein